MRELTLMDNPYKRISLLVRKGIVQRGCDRYKGCGFNNIHITHLV